MAVGSPLRWFLAVLVLTGGVALIVAVISQLTPERPSPPSAAPLPETLEERARLFTLAWLSGNTSGMMRLTEPSQDRELIRWLSLVRPPEWALRMDNPDGAAVQVKVASQKDRSAEVVISVRGSGSTRAATETTLRLRWLEKSGGWYFAPPSFGPTRAMPTARGSDNFD
jgi:hypothetical protein